MGASLRRRVLPGPRAEAQHRYRVIGKVRLLFFWIGSSDDVGGARLSWGSDGAGGQTLTLLVGSHPLRAPRGINAWGYLRERVRGDSAAVFGIGSLPDAHSPGDAEARFAKTESGLAAFGAFCSSISSSNVSASIGTISAGRDLTYDQLPHLLELVAASARWQERTATRPQGAAPGFLTAVDQLIHAMSEAARADALASLRLPPTSYVHKENVYDLRVRRIESLPELQLRSQAFRDLVRSDFSVRSRRTGYTMKFTLTHPTDGPLANVPVHVTFQPNRWFRIELRLDDAWSMADDPASDPEVLRRIGQVCAPHTTEDETWW